MGAGTKTMVVIAGDIVRNRFKKQGEIHVKNC
jgi:hypothetical protein